MAIVAFVIATLALVIALAARAKAAGLAQSIEDAARDARRRADNVGEEVSAELRTLRELLAAVAAGQQLDREQILEGRLWGEVDATRGRALFEAGEALILDVRTPGEVAAGKIPGALHIPIDDLEARRAEIARDDRTKLVYCAGGGRSAAACEFLSSQGWTNLLNLEGGFQSWTGPVERPS